MNKEDELAFFFSVLVSMAPHYSLRFPVLTHGRLIIDIDCGIDGVSLEKEEDEEWNGGEQVSVVGVKGGRAQGE